MRRQAKPRGKQWDRIRATQDSQMADPSHDSGSDRRHIISHVVLVIVAVYAGSLFSYWITTSFYGWLGMHPNPYLLQLTSVGVTLILIMAISFIFGRAFEQPQRMFWQSLMGAFRQMAKGNFHVQLQFSQLHAPREFHQLVHSINDMAAELGKLEQMRQEFVSNVSHEIQSPLTAILGFVEALKQSDVTPEDRQHYLDIIETESKRMSRLSENLLKLTSLESGALPFHPESFRLDRQLREVVLSLEPLWMKKEIQIELSLQHIHIWADKDLLGQVWINLLTNAIKFTAPNGWIFISLDAADDWVTACVRDTGSGIDEEDQARIFERFFKTDKSRQRSGAGSGLGLTIVKTIVDMLEGDIQVESQVGKGTTITVRLPNPPL